MKVKIGKFVNHFGPYQLAEKLMFWVPKEKDKYGFPHTAERVHNFGEWLAYGSILPEPAIGEEYESFNEKRKVTWLYRLLSWINSLKKRKIYVRIDPWDVWNMDSTLGYIIRPMLHQLKADKHGSPFVDDEDVPEHIRSTAARELTQKEKDNGHTDDNHFARWDWVLDEMIFAFDSIDGGPNQDWEQQFTIGNYDFRFEKISEDGTSQMINGPDHTAVTDWEARKMYGERIQNGFRLFGKYYQALWS
jgi:hypothetical protein